MRDIHNISLVELLPPSLLADEKVKAAAQAIDSELKKVTEAIAKLTLLYSVDDLEDAWLDELAWSLHVDFYDVTLPIEQKRELVKNSDAWHRRKGTPSAVEELVSTIFGDGEVEEWYDYGGQPYHFRVVTNNFAATNEQAEEFTKAVNSVKNARSWLETIILRAGDELNLYYGNVLHMGEFMTVEQVV
ncbi:phage tail protein I [Brevibacillus sp. H7]|uniref:phage tail protein I n=1 Tax=Brevibacillus sp. H7 TaxID=3349138 RepID=UPI003808976A